MKTKLLFLVCWAIAGLFQPLLAQQTPAKCYDYACMMKKARAYIQEKKFEEAVNSVTAAKRYSDAKEAEAEALLQEIFQEINHLRIQAEEATLAAQRSAQLAEEEQRNARRAEAEARRQRDSVIAARVLVEQLINKGKALENTFSDTSAYNYLYQTGLRYFEWDKIAQSRDYKNALTYFALARFLKPAGFDTLDNLVLAAKTGVYAEADFLNGQLDSARHKYAAIQSYVQKAYLSADFETKRLEQIQEVEKLFVEFRKKHDVHTTLPDTLQGNWWTLPADFQQYQGITALVFKNNPGTFRLFPTALGGLPHLQALSFINCTELRILENWEQTPQLQSLVLQDNPNLYSLEKLEHANGFISLSADNCPALTLINGCEKLEQLSIVKSAQARVVPLLQRNKHLKKLELADLPDLAFNSAHLVDLEWLSLSRMNVQQLQGLDKNTQLRVFKIDHLDQLQRFTPPGQLTTAYISHCHKLVGLDSWPQSDSLNKLVLYENDRLKDPPIWAHFPRLKHLLIQNNNDLDSIKGIKTIRHTERLFILNNTKLVTNSIHAGFGFEWGVDVSNVKLEFEHRQTIRWLKGADIGVKGVASYVRKKFEDDALYTKRETEGYLVGVVANYYSPNRIYAGLGVGFGRTRSLFADQTIKHKLNFVWINNLGYQFAPYFLKKDKMSLNMDLYTIFEKGDYFILPSFGLTYYHILDFNKETYFIRPGDSRRHVVRKWHKERIDDMPNTF